jgi:hypothetical protein
MKTSFFVYAFFVFALALLLNFNKFSLFIQSSHTKPYKIFPWQDPADQQVSKSQPGWLWIHVATALSRLFITLLLMSGNRAIVQNPTLRELDSVVHYMFFGLIVLNMHNFGQASTFVAITLNGIPSLIGFLAFYWKSKYRNILYFCAISSPVIFEFTLRLVNSFTLERFL